MSDERYEEMSGKQLAQHFRRLAALLASDEHTSFEGWIGWEANETPDGFNVKGVYRINDYGGQGAVHVFGGP